MLFLTALSRSSDAADFDKCGGPVTLDQPILLELFYHPTIRPVLPV